MAIARKTDDDRLKDFMGKFKSNTFSVDDENFNDLLFKASHFSINLFDTVNKLIFISEEDLTIDQEKFLLRKKILGQISQLNQVINSCLQQLNISQVDNPNIQIYFARSQLFSINFYPESREDFEKTKDFIDKNDCSLKYISEDLDISEDNSRAHVIRATVMFNFAYRIFSQYQEGCKFSDKDLFNALEDIKKAEKIYKSALNSRQRTQILSLILAFIRNIDQWYRKGRSYELGFIKDVEIEFMRIEKIYEEEKRNPSYKPLKVLSRDLSVVKLAVTNKNISYKFILGKINSSSLSVEAKRFDQDFEIVEAKDIIIRPAEIFNRAIDYFHLSLRAAKLIDEAPGYQLKQFFMDQFLYLCRSVEVLCIEALDLNLNPDFKLQVEYIRLRSIAWHINRYPISFAELKNDIIRSTETLEAIKDLYHNSCKQKHSFSEEIKDLRKRCGIDSGFSIAKASLYLAQEGIKHLHDNDPVITKEQIKASFGFADTLYEKYQRLSVFKDLGDTIRKVSSSKAGVRLGLKG